MTELVSIIIPVYNRAKLLKDAVESVLEQTYRPIEIIIVDDGSTDDTGAMAALLQERNCGTVKYIRKNNGGPGSARNLGLKYAKGVYIQYLDSDDLLLAEKLELQVGALRVQPGAGVAYCITMRHDADGRLSQWARTGERIDSIFPEFLIHRGWDTNSPLWRRDVCDAIGSWGGFRCMEDWEHDLRAGMLGVKAVHVPRPLVIVRDHSGSRASGMNSGFTVEFTRDFFEAHRSIWFKMRERGLNDWSYLQSFSRKMFWIARLCGERGLTAEAEQALAFSVEMTATHHLPAQLILYRISTRVLGWPRSVSLSERLRKFLRIA